MGNFLSQYSKEIVSLLVPFIVWILNGGLRRRARLVWTEQHCSSILTEEDVQEGDATVRRSFLVRTRSLFFKNTGSQSATQIELVFNWRPQYINLWPQRNYEVKINPEGRYIIVIDNLAASESFSCDLLSLHELPALLTVRYNESIAKFITTSPQEVHPRWKLYFVRYLMLSGSAASAYAIISLMQVLVLKTPVWFHMLPPSP